jgi:hypothetical protein
MENNEETFIITRPQWDELLGFFMNVNMPRVQSDPYVQLLSKISTQRVNAIKTVGQPPVEKE